MAETAGCPPVAGFRRTRPAAGLVSGAPAGGRGIHRGAAERGPGDERGGEARGVDRGFNRQERRAGELARIRAGGSGDCEWLALLRADRAYQEALTRVFAGNPVPALRAALAQRGSTRPARAVAVRALYEYDSPTDVVLALVPQLLALALDPDMPWGAQVRTILCRLAPATLAAALTPLVHDFLPAGATDADAVAGMLTLLHRASLAGLFERVHR